MRRQSDRRFIPDLSFIAHADIYCLYVQEDVAYDATEKFVRETKTKHNIAGKFAFALRIDFEGFSKIAKKSALTSWSIWRITLA